MALVPKRDKSYIYFWTLNISKLNTELLIVKTNDYIIKANTIAITMAWYLFWVRFCEILRNFARFCNPGLNYPGLSYSGLNYPGLNYAWLNYLGLSFGEELSGVELSPNQD